MSRLEPNAEPSMEEIIASIRKVVAEDSSVLRVPPMPPPGGTPYFPAPQLATPQCGFMSRKAFLKSSQAAEPGLPNEACAPRSAQRYVGTDSVGVQAPAWLCQREEKSLFERNMLPSLRERGAALERESLCAREDVQPKDGGPSVTAKGEAQPFKSATPLPVRPPWSCNDGIPSGSKMSETDEVVPVEDALPVIKDDGPAILIDAESEAVGKQVAESDAASIETQLSELLNEDLSILRQGRVEVLAEETVSKSKEQKDLRGEPPLSNMPPALLATESESSDPFAFDLGPSPFTRKPESQQRSKTSAPAAEVASVKRPAGPQPHGPVFASELSRSTARQSSVEVSFTEKNALYFGRSALGAVASTPTKNVAPLSPSPEHETPAAKPRQIFAAPSVSATLGPSRELEPLSNVFWPAPPALSVLETFAPAPATEVVPKYMRALRSCVPSEPPDACGPRDETGLHSLLTATTSEVGLDRRIEDDVADLLRPLLKAWLAENMPKFVERALRREISEQLLLGQKSPRD